jgi:hypothetical protein
MASTKILSKFHPAWQRIQTGGSRGQLVLDYATVGIARPEYGSEFG